MIESKYTANIHKKLPRHIYKWKISDSYAGGVPDAFYRNLNGGSPLWVEYKFIKNIPKRDTTMIVPNLSAQQLIWLKQAEKSGENAIVVIGCENLKANRNPAGVILSGLEEWEQGITTGEFELRAKGADYQSIADAIERATTRRHA